jgi:membrane-associated phospholipid phosphatase
MLPRLGFTDTLNQTAVNHHSSAIASLANPYAAMPSLHTAYALIFGVSGVVLVRRWWIRGMWALYPGLVVFSIIATANHFVLDAVAGATVAVMAGTFTMVVLPRRQRRGRPRPAPVLTPERACA